jgi:hypothetical protein
VNAIIRIALMFFLIQSLVVLGVMVKALLLAPPELPVLGRESTHDILIRSFAAVIGLLPRGFRSSARGRARRFLGKSLVPFSPRHPPSKPCQTPRVKDMHPSLRMRVPR